jgi:hypothetical protein
MLFEVPRLKVFGATFFQKGSKKSKQTLLSHKEVGE